MKLTLNGYRLNVKLEDGDRPFPVRPYLARGESLVLHHLKLVMNEAAGSLWGVRPFIKKRMWHDGHMVDDHQQYITARDKKSPAHIYLFNDHWATRGLDDDLHKWGEADLQVVTNVFEKRPTDHQDLTVLSNLCEFVNSHKMEYQNGRYKVVLTAVLKEIEA